MMTRDYADAYEDDSENVRGWAAQDAQEPTDDIEREFALEGDPLAMWDEIVRLRILCGKAADHLVLLMAQRDRVRAERDEAWATIARMPATAPKAIKVKPQPRVFRAGR